MNLKNSGDSTGFEPMTCAMPVQCSNQLSYEVTRLRAGQFVGLMLSPFIVRKNLLGLLGLLMTPEKNGKELDENGRLMTKLIRMTIHRNLCEKGKTTRSNQI